MKVILVLQIRKVIGLTGQLLFCSTRVLQVNRTVRTIINVFAIYSYSFLFNSTIPQLYQNDPALKRIVLLRLTWVQLLIEETFIFKDTLQCKTLDENQLWTIKFNHSYEVWSEGPPKEAKQKNNVNTNNIQVYKTPNVGPQYIINI